MSSAAFDEHVASQAEAVRRLSTEGAVPRLDPARPVVFTGIGTSLHACKIAAAWTRTLSGGRVRAHALDAHDLALMERVTAADQVVVVSHRGTKQRPNEVLAMAADAGAYTCAVTGHGSHRPEADAVIRTVEQERASTHTVSYVGSLTVLARLVAGLLGAGGEPLLAGLGRVPDAIERTLALPVAGEAADALVESAPAPGLIAGSGLDGLTAEEAALKLKEGTYRWVEGLNTEFGLHGMPAVYSGRTVAYLLHPAHDDAGRTQDMARLLSRIGAMVFFAGSDSGADVALPFAPVPVLVRPFVAIVPFHRLVSSVAARVGASPDLTHLEAEPWSSAVKDVRL